MKQNNFKAVKLFLLVLTCLMTTLNLTSCSDSSSGGGGGGGGDDFTRGTSSAFVLTSDYTTGNCSAINLETLTASNDLAPAGSIHSDASAVYYQDKIYVINREGMDSITVLDASSPGTILNQFDVGALSNPHDMVFVNETKAYISLYGSNDLLVVDPTDKGDDTQIKQRIDLSPYMDDGDTDGKVEADCLDIVGDYLFVSMQRIDLNNNYNKDADAIIAVINVSDNTLVDVDAATDGTQGIVLTGKNPQYMCYDHTLNKLLVSETGEYGVIDGGIEIVDPYTFEAEGFVIAESAENGASMGDFVVVGDKIYTIICDANWVYSVGEFQYNSEAHVFNKTKEIFTATNYFSNLSADGFDRILIPETNPEDPGVRFYEILTGELSEPVYVGMPPNVIIAF